VTKHYTNGEITVVWQPDLCRHGGACARGLGDVFNPRRRPWIEMQHADSDRIAAQVDRCPSRALTWFKNAPDGGR
jgi:uncharacterized Fe-S cluster protein YjdI